MSRQLTLTITCDRCADSLPEDTAPITLALNGESFDLDLCSAHQIKLIDQFEYWVAGAVSTPHKPKRGRPFKKAPEEIEEVETPKPQVDIAYRECTTCGDAIDIRGLYMHFKHVHNMITSKEERLAMPFAAKPDTPHQNPNRKNGRGHSTKENGSPSSPSDLMELAYTP